MTASLLCLFAGLASGAIGFEGLRLKLLFRDHVPPAVRRLLAHPIHRAELLGPIRRMAGYVNLTPPLRRERAAELCALYLDQERLSLTDAELNLTVELLYAWLKARDPEAIAPGPQGLGPLTRKQPANFDPL